jgi:glycosyltransferase involved in cell wall biosynthesis
MRILIISYFFPPFNTIGAVRVGKTAKYLQKLGHEVMVVTADNQQLAGPIPASLPLEIPETCIVSTGWLNLSAAPPLLQNSLFRRVAKSGILKNGHIGWFPYAYRAASRLIGLWKPDIIYASAMPTVSLITASLLSSRFRLPWVAEFRDLWTDNHYIKYSPRRRKLEEYLETKVLSSTSGMVTVSEPLADILIRKYKKPTEVILNGYDLEDYPKKTSGIPTTNSTLLITYTGTIYGGRQDPSPLFKALQYLRTESVNICVEFYGTDIFGTDCKIIEKAVQEYQLSGMVINKPAVPYHEALRKQQNSDILLLILWDDPSQKGVYTGKLFEYIGAQRPILAVGSNDSAAANLIQERKLGVVLNDPGKIAEQLKMWIEQKKEDGIPDNMIEMTADLSRYEQTVRLDKFLSGILSDHL